MRVALDTDSWTLHEISDLEWVMLIQLPDAADFTRSARGTDRLLPGPVVDPEPGDSSVADWKEYIQPELESQFTRNVEVVARDLDAAQELPGHDGDTLRQIRVPIDHAETWYSVLNQARLILNEEHEISQTERDLFFGHQKPTDIDEKLFIVMVQYRVYGAIQEFLLTRIMGG